MSKSRNQGLRSHRSEHESTQSPCSLVDGDKRISISSAEFEAVATILDRATPGDAGDLLNEWLHWAGWSRLAPFVKLAQTVRKHAVGILGYLDTRMTNGPVEGMNNKLRVIARRAYGFHSPGPLISMLYLCCGGIELTPPLPIRV